MSFSLAHFQAVAVRHGCAMRGRGLLVPNYQETSHKALNFVSERRQSAPCAAT
jgi:hypothetical protein